MSKSKHGETEVNNQLWSDVTSNNEVERLECGSNTFRKLWRHMNLVKWFQKKLLDFIEIKQINDTFQSKNTL